MLIGTPVHVKETPARFTTDVRASWVFGINGKSLKDPDAEFGRFLPNIFHFSVKKGLAMLTGFFALYLKALFNLKSVNDKTTNYTRYAVWNTV
jgi:hypothetical protein